MAHHGQVFQAAQMGVEMRLFGYVAHALFVGDEVVANGLAAEEDLARADLDEPGDHLHGGGFAGAVGAQIAGDFARGCGKADVIYGEHARKTLGDVAQFERHGCRPPAAFHIIRHRPGSPSSRGTCEPAPASPDKPRPQNRRSADPGVFSLCKLCRTGHFCARSGGHAKSARRNQWSKSEVTIILFCYSCLD